MLEIKIFSTRDTRLVFRSRAEAFTLGRSIDCDFRIPDPEASRLHGRVHRDASGYRIVNQGRTPLRVNDRPVASERPLTDGDMLQVGLSRFLVHIGRAEVEGPVPPAAIRLRLPPDPGPADAPYLEIADGSDAPRRFPLTVSQVRIGRAAESDIQVQDRRLSRRHCTIDRREDTFWIVKQSRLGSVRVNDQETIEAPLSAGDRIRIGSVDVCFYRPAAAAGASSAGSWELRVRHGDGPPRNVPLTGDTVRIGRGRDAAVRLSDPEISRRHCKLRWTARGWELVRSSRTGEVQVNGRPVDRRDLVSGDRIEIGAFRLDLAERSATDPGPAAGDVTVMVAEAQAPELGSRLVWTAPDGAAATFALVQERTTLGRSDEADCRLEDASVSRIHAVFDRRADGFYIRRADAAGVLRVNKVEADNQRLFSGDQIQAGAQTLSFLSDDPTDSRVFAAPLPRHSRLMVRAAQGLLAATLLLFSGFAVYHYVYLPSRGNAELRAAETRFEAGACDEARRIIERLLAEEPSPGVADRAAEMLADQTLQRVNRMASKTDKEAAKAFLREVLRGREGEAAFQVLQARLDGLHFMSGRAHEAAGRPLRALADYACVRFESPYAHRSRHAMAALWEAMQVGALHHCHASRVASSWVAEAGRGLRKGSGLDAHQASAVGLLQAATAIDPENDSARRALSALRSQWRREALEAYTRRDWETALAGFERVGLLGPMSPNLIEKHNTCRRMLAEQGRRLPAALLDDAVAEMAATHLKRLREGRREMVAALMAEARAHTAAGRLLSPLYRNAYAAYHAVLALDPDHSEAGPAAEAVCRHHQMESRRRFDAGRYADALPRLVGLALLDPDDPLAWERLSLCRHKARLSPAGPRQAAAARLAAVIEAEEPAGPMTADSIPLWIASFLRPESAGDAVMAAAASSAPLPLPAP